MNLVDPGVVGVAEAYDAVAARAEVAGAELVGLVTRQLVDDVDPDRWEALDLSPERTIEARLGGADEKGEKVVADAGPASGGQLGLTLRPLSRDEKRESKLDAGLVIEDVGGAAARAGIQAGDVLLAINGKTVQSVEQVKEVIAGKPKSVALLVQRDGEKIFVPVKVG